MKLKACAVFLLVSMALTAQALAFNGTYGGPRMGNDGWGIYLQNGGYALVLGGVDFIGAIAPAVSGQWTHVALVRDNGFATL